MSVNPDGNDLSDQTVIESARFRVSEPVDGTRRRRKGTRTTPSPVTRTVVDPDVWATALRIADGDTSRIEVRSATSVVVHNGAWR